MRVLEGALQVSDYTDKVDIFAYRASKLARIQEHLGSMFAIISGLLVVSKGKKGQALVEDKQVSENPELFASIFEVGRRYKITNPDQLRANYGKMMYMLQDMMTPEISEALGFGCVRTILTVDHELDELDAAELLEEASLAEATAPVQVGGSVEAKHSAMQALVKKYGNGDKRTEQRIERVLLSIADDEALTSGAVRPVQQVLDLLHKYYDPASVADKAHSLAISSGRNGARLSHNHQTQYKYIEQSLLLWREILSHLSQMWALAEGDLLDGRGYRLRDTGQGVHRVQGAPRVGRFMHTMLESMQEATRGGWVGSTAVHLGDNDVPNALVWIDKYSQIPRILAPVVSVVENLDEVVESTPGLPEYVKGVFGSVEACRKIILTDFFRHAFDGSGADNYYDAGSCIDGRLTSAWNWCSRISKKPYYHIFKMAGFVGFDGSFNK